MIKSGDVVLIEGPQGGTPVDVEGKIVSDLFTAREYEKLQSHKIYTAATLGEMRGR